MLKTLLNKLANLAVLVVAGYAFWYAYSNWFAGTTSTFDETQRAEYDCRKGLAKFAEDQLCRSSESCRPTSDELAAMKRREVDIGKYCN